MSGEPGWGLDVCKLAFENSVAAVCALTVENSAMATLVEFSGECGKTARATTAAADEAYNRSFGFRRSLLCCVSAGGCFVGTVDNLRTHDLDKCVCCKLRMENCVSRDESDIFDPISLATQTYRNCSALKEMLFAEAVEAVLK